MIAYDLQAMQSISNSERGIARFVTDLTYALVKDGHADLIDLFLWNDALPPSPRFAEFGLGKRLRAFSDVRGLDVDVLHIGSPFELPRASDLLAPVRAKRLVVTCYDLIPYLFPDRYLTDPGFDIMYRTRLGLIATADAVVTDSQSAADDVSAHLGLAPERLTVIGAGVGDQFRPAQQPLSDRMALLRAAIPGILPRFVLVPTAADWRKNSIGAIEAFAGLPEELRQRHQLVLFCKLAPEHRRVLDEVCAREGVTDRVIITGFVPDEVLVLLYQTAELVVYPTFYEGFGLPILEARHCGARVICSNSSSLPEVLVDERARFNPYRRGDVTALIQRALTDEVYAASLEAVPDAGFTWSLAASRLAQVYRSMLADIDRCPPITHTATAATRVGVVGVLPPTAADESERTEAVLNAIAEIDGVDLTAFVAGDRPGMLNGYDFVIENVSALPALWASGEIDVVVYLLANNDAHAPLARMADLVPGHVVLHGATAGSAMLGDDREPPARHLGHVPPAVRRAISVFTCSAEDAQLVREFADREAAVLTWSEARGAFEAARQLTASLTAGLTR